MSSSSVATPPNVNSAQQGASSPEVIQRLIDQVAGFNLFVVPQGGNTGKDFNGLTGFVVSADLHRFSVVTQRPTSNEIQATNLMGENVGRVDLRWFMIPDNFVARP